MERDVADDDRDKGEDGESEDKGLMLTLPISVALMTLRRNEV